MDYLNLLVTLSFTGAIFLLFLKYSIFSRRESPHSLPLPPGPPPRLITGNISHVRNGPYPEPYRCIALLAKEYGDVMTLRLGANTCIVFSSAAAAKAVLNKHDDVLSDRTVRHVITADDHHKTSVIWMSPCSKWRNLRKICAVQMFAAQRLNSTHELREEKVHQLWDYVSARAHIGAPVDVGALIFTTVLNMISNTLFSADFAAYGSELASEFEETVLGVMQVSARPNITDSFPVLRFVDPGNGRKKFGSYCRRMTDIFNAIIKQRMAARKSTIPTESDPCPSQRKDVLDGVLDLNLNSDYGLTLDDIKGLFLDLFVAGIDTSASVMEWAMAEIIRNPDKMRRARTELREVLGNDGAVLETTIGNLPYLQAVVKETLRLYPPGPFLLPHKARSNVELAGYRIPKDAMILINVWSIGRDPAYWSPNAHKFVPERFLQGTAADYKGRDYDLLPFGSGRRLCPGLPLATRMIHLVLATLIQFEWKLEGGIDSQDLDMTPKSGVTLVKKAQPIRAIPIHT